VRDTADWAIRNRPAAREKLLSSATVTNVCRWAGGAVFEPGAAWSSHVVVDGNLITGQNPGSAEAAGQALLSALGH
jgi:putative intracellular protease/amidase